MEVFIHHKYKEEMIVPLCALNPNYELVLGEKISIVHTADGYDARCIEQSWVDILSYDTEDDLERLYGLSTIDYLRSWRKRLDFGSMYFLKLKLRAE